MIATQPTAEPNAARNALGAAAPELTTARHWFSTPDAFGALCVAARDRAEEQHSDFDRQLSAEARFKHLRHGLDAPLRTIELHHLCRIAGVAIPPTQGTVNALLAELDTPLLRHLRAGYMRVGTLNALRAAALIHEEIESRGETLL
jgi:hypothetical protein